MNRRSKIPGCARVGQCFFLVSLHCPTHYNLTVARQSAAAATFNP